MLVCVRAPLHVLFTAGSVVNTVLLIMCESCLNSKVQVVNDNKHVAMSAAYITPSYSNVHTQVLALHVMPPFTTQLWLRSMQAEKCTVYYVWGT